MKIYMYVYKPMSEHNFMQAIARVNRVFRTDLERAKTISGAVNFIVGGEKLEEKDSFVKEALMLHQALLLCSSLASEKEKHLTHKEKI